MDILVAPSPDPSTALIPERAEPMPSFRVLQPPTMGSIARGRETMTPAAAVCWPTPGQPHGGILFTVMDTTMAFVGTKAMFERAGFEQVGVTDAVASKMPRVVMRKVL